MSWLARAHRALAGLSDVLYHSTGWWGAYRILEEDRFKLSTTLGTDSDARGHGFYFFSMSRMKFGGYQRAGTPVTFKLDGRKLHQRYRGGPFDYWSPMWREVALKDGRINDALRYDENEDRIWSDKPEIPGASRYIEEVHVLIPKDLGTFAPERSGLIRQVVRLAKQRKLPLYLYDDRQAYQRQDIARTIPASSLDLRGPLPKQYGGLSGPKIDPYIEIYHARRMADLSPEARKRANSISWHPEDTVQSLKADLHNYRDKPEAQAKIQKLVRVMRAEGLKTIGEFVTFLRQKIKELP